MAEAVRFYKIDISRLRETFKMPQKAREAKVMLKIVAHQPKQLLDERKLIF